MGIRSRSSVITGMGVINAIADGIPEFAASLRAGKSGIGFLNHPPEHVPVRIGAEIKDWKYIEALNSIHGLSDELRQRTKKSSLRSPFPVQVSVYSALQAWRMAELETKPAEPERIGLVIAGSNLSQHYIYRQNERFRESPEYLPPSYALHFMDTDHLGTISEILNIQGEGFTVGGASASGNIGLIKGAQLVQYGLVDVCLVVGAVADLSPMEWQGFHAIGAMGGKRFANDPSLSCRPFDRQHEGFIYGQGSACLVLESSESAARRGVRSVAEYLGGGIVLDANRLSDPTEKGEAKAMNIALQQSGIEPKDIDYISAHGTSSPLGDDTEIMAIRQVFREYTPQIWINSTKSLTGHCIYAAGMTEAVATVIQMQEGFVHPNLNLEQPIDDECRFVGKRSMDTELNMAMSNSFGFGGINSSIVLKKGERTEWQ
ncbi:beta-ketoacyl synthase N-terminal-like domain-containing protein [Paenibacillus harenae]|uniref:beta-ketoacyl synthase N-terminal-like domain-containing protein n=1 Tax=Paenibacillus harenae TaxID=306543 RepID=UPI00278E64C3|nr:beta-ketoacyl synthase N-terminal-like domain-containing protein [Paenibacillus harenae]MDQ0059009.1 malonyl-ACP decarboxylase [Paenibacillus harenae]